MVPIITTMFVKGLMPAIKHKQTFLQFNSKNRIYFSTNYSKIHNKFKMSTQTTHQSSASTVPADERNIEIKARIGSDQEFERRLEIAKKLTQSEGELIVQRDVFFNTQTGRFKLRYLQPPARSQLVYYDRPDVAGPKLSKFNKTELDEPEVMEKILSQTNGKRGVLAKKRYLFMYERTRIHLDKVEDLGNFMEFEVCLLPEQTIEEGQKVADLLIKEFGIKEEDLMTGAYFDELNK